MNSNINKILALAITVLSILILSSCGSDSYKPFKGKWKLKRESIDSMSGFNSGSAEYLLELDFYDKSIKDDNGNAVAGLLTITDNTGPVGGTLSDIIKTFNTSEEFPYSASITYIQGDTGEEWTASLQYDPITRRITFANGLPVTEESAKADHYETDADAPWLPEPEWIILNPD